jgi:polysaccharide export outer membrane protein
MLAASVSGCVTMSSSPPTASVQQEPVGADLDSYLHARSADNPMTANAQLVAAGPGAAVAVIATDPATAFASEPPYRLDSGDRLRIIVYGQEGLSNSYFVDAGGVITMPLIKSVKARGLTTEELAHIVADRLRGGYIREPHVAIEVEIYRPFFILGEVTIPGQYAYVPHMTAEHAIAIAGGFTPRAYRTDIKLDRPAKGGVVRNSVPLLTRIRPGDTIIVKERWF